LVVVIVLPVLVVAGIVYLLLKKCGVLKWRILDLNS
jgi:hypothetical protein